jgi:4-amino-4-deoxy-L-arabinose transferase-like glycosyltransferase
VSSPEVIDGGSRETSGAPRDVLPLASWARSWAIAVLLLAALILFTARMGDLSLPSLEDAFYAREAIEMARAGRIYTVTWNGTPTHQHPPLHLFIVARTFDVLGERDLAARLPTVLLALGVLALTWRIGVLTLGRVPAVAGTACLLATPIFVDNARRLMMEVPLTFWIAATVWVYLEAGGRWLMALAFPLGAAILTKSVLGLMPLMALVGALASEELRSTLRRPWVWIGVILGLGLGASWLFHQWWTQGSGAVTSHLVSHVMRRSTRSFGLGALLDYPLILLKFYQPIILPGLIGLWLILRRPGPLRARGAVLATWIVLPVVLYSMSSFRTPRFVFPILPALALCAGQALVAIAPRFAACFGSILVPAGAVGVALGIWWNPMLLTRDANAAFKRNAGTIQAFAPAGESVPYLGNHYWASASPLLYYAERHLAPSSRSAAEAVEAGRRHSGRLLLVTRRRLPEVTAVGAAHRVVLEGRDWVLLQVRRDDDPAA